MCKFLRGHWLVILGAFVTFVYPTFLIFGVEKLTFSEFQNLDLNEMGDFFAGVFAPLAFLWLVLGYFQQGEELKQSSEVLRLQVQELKESVEVQHRQAQSVEANTRHAARDVFLQFVDGLLDELVAAAVEIAQQRSENTHIATRYTEYQNMALLFIRLSQGVTDRKTEYIHLYQRYSEKRWPINRYVATFEALIGEARAADPEGKLEEYYRNSGAGLLYKNICEYFSQFLNRITPR